MTAYASLGAAAAVGLTFVIITAVLRQKTVRRILAHLFVLANLLLVGAIVANMVVALVVQGGSGNVDLILSAKKAQAVFDLLFAVATGAFIVAVTTPNITNGRDFVRYVRENFPEAYFLYVVMVGLGIGASIASDAKVVLTPGDYYLEISAWYQYIIFAVTLVILAFIPFKLVRYLRAYRPAPRIVHRTILIMIGLMGYIVAELVFEVVLAPFGSGVRSLGFLVQTGFVSLVAFSLKEPTFLEALLVPASEANLKTGKRFQLEPGYAYLIVDEEGKQAFEIFRDLVTHGAEGLCITRVEPGKIAREYGLEKTPILWLSRVATLKNAIKPAPIENVAMAVNHFLEVGKESVILLDGLEYLVAHNKFPSVLSLLHDLVDKIAMHNAILLLPVNPGAWNEQEFNLAKRDLKLIGTPPVRAFAKAAEPPGAP